MRGAVCHPDKKRQAHRWPAPTRVALCRRVSGARVCGVENQTIAFSTRCLGPRPKHTTSPPPLFPLQAPVKYDHLLVALVDASYTSLSDGSRTALATTGFLARQNGAARVSVLFCDAETPPVEGQNARERAVGAALESAGVASVSFIERALDDDNAAAAVGDAADSVAADLLVLSSDAVHAKAVDANLLAEFVDCPVLLLP